MVDRRNSATYADCVKQPQSKSVTLSPCQIVAWNLGLERRAQGWSQAEMAKRLGPYIGYRMSRAALSKAERSLHGGPIRRFDADEIFALARIFNKPVGDFFIPPEPHYRGKAILVNGKPGDPKAHVSSKPLKESEVMDLAMRVVSPPATEAERERQEAFGREIIQMVAQATAGDYRRAFSDALKSFLKEHPDALRQLISEGIPSEVFDRAELTAPQRLKVREPLLNISAKIEGNKR